MEPLIVQIAVAVNTRSLYPANHPRVVRAVEDTVSNVRRVISDRNSDSITFLIVGDDLVAEQEVLRKATLSNRQFVDILRRRGIERLTLASGLDAGEANQLISALAMGEQFDSTPHVIAGRVAITIDQEETTNEKREISINQLEIVRDAFERFRDDRKLPVTVMEEMVWSFIDALSRTTRQILPLTKLREHVVHIRALRQRLTARARAGAIVRDPGDDAPRIRDGRPASRHRKIDGAAFGPQQTGQARGRGMVHHAKPRRTRLLVPR